MHPLIRFAAALVFLSLAALSVLASPKSSRPVSSTILHLDQIRNLDDFLRDSATLLTPDNRGSVIEKLPSDGDRICSCQILNLESSNYDHRYVVLLAERRTNGSDAGFKAARNRILKERKQLKKLFYDKVKLVAEMQGKSSCKSMYFRLHTADHQLQLYEILYAD